MEAEDRAKTDLGTDSDIDDDEFVFVTEDDWVSDPGKSTDLKEGETPNNNHFIPQNDDNFQLFTFDTCDIPISKSKEEEEEENIAFGLNHPILYSRACSSRQKEKEPKTKDLNQSLDKDGVNVALPTRIKQLNNKQAVKFSAGPNSEQDLAVKTEDEETSFHEKTQLLTKHNLQNEEHMTCELCDSHVAVGELCQNCYENDSAFCNSYDSDLEWFDHLCYMFGLEEEIRENCQVTETCRRDWIKWHGHRKKGAKYRHHHKQ